MRGVGYSYDAVKIFMPAGAKKPVYAPYVEHVPPDVTACIFWLKNRDPAHWRDAWQVDQTLGKYILSEHPMSQEEWVKERATMVDVTPNNEEQINGGQEHLRLAAANTKAARGDAGAARGSRGVRPGAHRAAARRSRQDLGDQEPPDDGDVG